jgi:hypothetical protein
MILCSLDLAWLCFLGWENWCLCQNFKILKSWPLLWRHRPPILPKIVQKQFNHHKSRQNHHLFLKFGMTMLFGVRKPVLVSKFQNFKILTPYVTSQNPNVISYAVCRWHNTESYGTMGVRIGQGAAGTNTCIQRVPYDSVLGRLSTA